MSHTEHTLHIRYIEHIIHTVHYHTYRTYSYLIIFLSFVHVLVLYGDGKTEGCLARTPNASQDFTFTEEVEAYPKRFGTRKNPVFGCQMGAAWAFQRGCQSSYPALQSEGAPGSHPLQKEGWNRGNRMGRCCCDEIIAAMKSGCTRIYYTSVLILFWFWQGWSQIRGQSSCHCETQQLDGGWWLWWWQLPCSCC